MKIQLLLIGVLLACAPVFATAQEQTWQMNIKNADIHEFVAQVADITGRTFVVDPRLKGNVTVISSTSMNTEAIYELFLSVLRVHNFTATPSGNVIRIQQNATGKQTPGAQGKLSNIAPEELVTRVIGAQNVESAELVKILRPLIPQYGHIASVASPNVVIISDHADNIVRLMKIIRQIDVSDEEDVTVVPMKHAYVGTIVALLEKVAPEQIGRNAKGPQRIQIIANERNNSMVLRGKPRPVAEVLKLIDKLDQPATASGATQVIPLQHADAVNVTEILNGIITGGKKRGADEGGAVEETTIHADETLNAIVVRADPAVMTEIVDVIKQLDVRRAQVLIEAAIVEIRFNDTFQLGVEMAAVDARGESVPLISTSLDGIIGNVLQGLLPDENGVISAIEGVASLTSPTLAAAKIDANAISFGAVIQALATNTDANLLSTPSILTLDNQEAKIVVGNEVPFRTGSFTTTGDGSNNPFTTVQREDVGIQLTVTPHVHDGTSVRLDVAQEITNVVESAIGEGGFADVVTSKRTIETTILAEDRETIVLGGLIQNNETDTLKKVPLLGSIPFLGALFRSTSTTTDKINLLVFLRPTVIRTDEDATAVTQRKYEDIWEVEINSVGHQPIDAFFRGEN